MTTRCDIASLPRQSFIRLELETLTPDQPRELVKMSVVRRVRRYAAPTASTKPVTVSFRERPPPVSPLNHDVRTVVRWSKDRQKIAAHSTAAGPKVYIASERAEATFAVS